MKHETSQQTELVASDKPINVNGNTTPITHQNVELLQREKWNSPDVSLEFLGSQLAILDKRLLYAQQLRQQSMVVMIQQGISELNTIISDKLIQQ